MTKERLEELIKQRGTIYIVFPECNFLKETELNNCRFGIKNNELTELFLKTVDTYEMWRLHETKEQAEWALKTVAERIERFEPPMWEEIKGYYRFNFMNCENGAWKKYSFELLKKQDDKAKEGGYISIWTGTKDIYNKTTPTKENYEKACEIVRDLFKGEKWKLTNINI